MASRHKSRRLITAGATLGVAALALAACGSSSSSETTPLASVKPGCEMYAPFGDLTGKQVTVYTTIVAPEQQTQVASYQSFEDCTGVKVNYEGDRNADTQIATRVEGNNAPDIFYAPQPGSIASLVENYPDAVKPAPPSVEANVDKWFGPDWKKYGSVNGTLYAAPLGANVKSFVWYSPKEFAAKGWTIPTTWDEMMALTKTIAATGIKPWCAGFESGGATGWPGTDWLEETLLRTAGPEVYDQWVDHTIPFNDPQIVTALNKVGDILKNPAYANGGFGDPSTIATTAFGEAGNPILVKNGAKCAMMQIAGFYAAQWPKGTNVAEDGDAFAFYLPPIDPSKGKPVEGGAEFVVAFNDNPATVAFQTFLSSPEWANAKAKATPAGGWISANKGLEIGNLTSPIDKLSVQLLTQEGAVVRFDGSDLMPAKVGAGTFWKGMVKWVTGQDTQTTLDQIEASWPK